MTNLIFCTFILPALIITYFHTNKAAVTDLKELSSFEYGVHVRGEQLSYHYTGSIPAFEPVFKLNATPVNQNLEKHFTYLVVHYINPVSKVAITFDPKTMMLTIYQKFPFISMPLAVHGYSMPLHRILLR